MKLFDEEHKAFTIATAPTVALALGIYISYTNEQWGVMIICAIGVAVGATVMYFVGKDKKC